jgi:hypothetical protein
MIKPARSPGRLDLCGETPLGIKNTIAEYPSAMNTQGLHAMSNGNTKNNSFSHAFLPGLILGLIIGAVAGAFLPDFLAGPSIPATAGGGQMNSGAPARETNSPAVDPEVQEALDEAQRQLEEQGEDAAEQIEENLPTPPSDG